MPEDDRKDSYTTIDNEPATGNVSSQDSTEPTSVNKPAEDVSENERPTETTAPKEQVDTLPHPGPGMMVLQWLVYALWGWTVLVLSGLIALVVNQLLTSRDERGMFDLSGGISYLLAGVIVLFVISLICDMFYAKAEKKFARSTGSNVIMIIHAVLFALFGIGALITSVFGAVSLMIGDSNDMNGAFAGIISGAVIFFLYGVTLLRTLRPGWIKGVVPVYWIIMTVAILISVILGIVGPAAQARLAAQDEVVERGLPSLAMAVSRHANTTGELPTTLTELNTDNGSLGEDAKKLIESDRVEYKPGELISKQQTDDSIPLAIMNRRPAAVVDPVYHFQLCVEYKSADTENSYDSDYQYVPEGQRYDTSISTYGHKAGEQCYDVQTQSTY